MIGLGLALVGEAVQDESIGRVYGGQSLSAELRVAAVVNEWIEADLALGYRRAGGFEVGDAGPGPATALWYAPVSATAGPRYDAGTVVLGARLGPAFVPWAETPGTMEGIGYHGGRWGLQVEGSARVGIGTIAPNLADLEGLSLELGAGWRWTPRSSCDGAPCGLDFSAARAGLGVVAEL